MKLTVVLTAIGAALTVALVAAAMMNPLYGIAGLVIALFAVWACYRPHTAACTLAFLTAAFPKAGVKLGDFPLPIFLPALFLAVILVGIRSKRTAVGTAGTLLTLLWLTFVTVRIISIQSTSGAGPALAFAAWTAGPIVLLYLAATQAAAHPRFRRALEGGFLLSVAFGIVQLVGGVDRTAIPGLTYAYGDDITQKNNIIYTGGVADYSKIPSTYQNGNIYGLVAAAFFAMALARVIRRQGSRFDYLLILASGLAIALSGSRTAIIAAAVAALIVFLRGGNVGKKLALVALIGIIGVVVVTLQPGLVDRYSLDNVLDSGGAGRSDMWSLALATHPTSDFWIGAPIDPQIEGGIGMLLRIGWVGVALLASTVGVLLRGRRQMMLPVVVLIIGAIIDSSYLLFPTWFLVAALAVDCGHDETAPPALTEERKRGREVERQTDSSTVAL